LSVRTAASAAITTCVGSDAQGNNHFRAAPMKWTAPALPNLAITWCALMTWSLALAAADALKFPCPNPLCLFDATEGRRPKVGNCLRRQPTVRLFLHRQLSAKALAKHQNKGSCDQEQLAFVRSSGTAASTEKRKATRIFARAFNSRGVFFGIDL
jgi:hypothetical protein